MSKCRDNRKIISVSFICKTVYRCGYAKSPPPQRVAGGIDKIKVLLLH